MNRQFCLTGYNEDYNDAKLMVQKKDGGQVHYVMESTAFALTGTPSLRQKQQFSKQRLSRQCSDNGQESGIGSDSDSGHSAVYMDSYGDTFHPASVQIFAAPAFVLTGSAEPPMTKYPVNSVDQFDSSRLVNGHNRLASLNSYQTEIRKVCYDGVMGDMEWDGKPGTAFSKNEISGGYDVRNGVIDYDIVDRVDSNNNKSRNPSVNVHNSNGDEFLSAQPIYQSNSAGIKHNGNPGLMESPRYSAARKQLFSSDEEFKHPAQIYNRSISDQPRPVQVDRQYFKDAKQFVSINKNLAACRDGYDRQHVPQISSSNPQIGSQQFSSSAEKWKNGAAIGAPKQDGTRRFRRTSELAEQFTYSSTGILPQTPVDQPNYSSLPWAGNRHDSRLQLAGNYSSLADSSLEIEYSPEKLRMQCESLQMRLSNDFSAPIRGYSTVAAEADALRETRRNEVKLTTTRLHTPSITHPSDANHGSVEHFPGSTVRQLSASSVSSYIQNSSSHNGARTPIRQLSPDAGVVQNPAFQADQPATLPRPGRTEISEEYVASTEPRTKPSQAPTRRWTIMDRTPKVMRTVMHSASRLVNKVVTPARQTSTPAGLDGSETGFQDLPQNVGHQRQSSMPSDIQNVETSPTKRLNLFSSRNSKSGSTSSVNSEASTRTQAQVIAASKYRQDAPRLQKSIGGEERMASGNVAPAVLNSNIANSRQSRRDVSTVPPSMNMPVAAPTSNISAVASTSSQLNSNKLEDRGKRLGTSPSIASALRSRFTSPFQKHPRQTSNASDSNQKPSPVKQEKTYKSRGSSVDGNSNGAGATFSLAAPYLFGRKPEENKKNRYRKEVAYSPRMADKAAEKANDKVSHPILNVTHQPVLDGRSARKLNNKPQPNNRKNQAEEKPGPEGECRLSRLHPDLAPRSPGGPSTRESSPGSVTGRTRKMFRTFHGSITPISWSDDDSIVPASPRQDIELQEINSARDMKAEPRTESVSGVEMTIDETCFSERLTISDSHYFEDPDDTMEIPSPKESPREEFSNGNIHVGESTREEIVKNKISTDNYNTLKSRKLPIEDDGPSAKRQHRSKTRSASCSANDTRTRHYVHEGTYDIKVKLPSVLLGRQTSDNLTADEREFLEQISMVACNEYNGITAGRQAVNDVDLLLDIVKDLLIQPASQGICFERTITGDEFNAARDGLSEISRKFVIDCKTLVSSAGRTRSLLVININSSMKTFIQLIARCREMLFCLSAPDDKKGLIEIVSDVGNGYRRTIASASRAVGKPLSHSHVRQLMGEVQALTQALGRIVQTLAKLEYVRLVRRF